MPVYPGRATAFTLPGHTGLRIGKIDKPDARMSGLKTASRKKRKNHIRDIVRLF